MTTTSQSRGCTFLGPSTVYPRMFCKVNPVVLRITLVTEKNISSPLCNVPFNGGT